MEESISLPWVALVVRPRAERKLQAGLLEAGIENFLPWHGPDEEIGALRRAIDSGLPLGPWPFLKAGQRVRIEHGLLAGLEGSLVDDSGEWGVGISITALERSVSIEVPRDIIRPIAGGPQRHPTVPAETYGC